MDTKQKLDLHLGRWVLRIEANRSSTYFTTTLRSPYFMINRYTRTHTTTSTPQDSSETNSRLSFAAVSPVQRRRMQEASAGLNGLQVQLDSPKAGSTALQYRHNAQESICINLQSHYDRCCNMRVFHNARPPNAQRREVEFGYSRESAWLLTETTIAWQGRTEARFRVRVKDVCRVEEQSHREPSSASVSNQHTCRSHHSAALPKTKLLLDIHARRQR